MKTKRIFPFLLTIALTLSTPLSTFAEDMAGEGIQTKETVELAETVEDSNISGNETAITDGGSVSDNIIEAIREYTPEEIAEYDRQHEERLRGLVLEQASAEEEVTDQAVNKASGPITQLMPLNINDAQAKDGLEPFTSYHTPRLGTSFDTDLSKDRALTYTLTFGDKVNFSKTPSDFDRDEVINWGKDPGLGVDILHKHGFDGTGAVIAYVDQPIADHEAYKNINLHYTNNTSMTDSVHGPAVLSLLAGKNTGTAPGAEIYYYGHAAWKTDQTTHAECLYQIIEQNKKLPEGKKIRMVGFSDNIDPGEANPEAFEEAVRACEDAGIMVWFCGDYGAAYFAPESDRDNPDNVYREKWCPASFQPRLVFVPTASRTTACVLGFNYTYWADGGLSWAMPYALGIYADALAIDPSLTKEDLRNLVMSTATLNASGLRVINPVEFIAQVLERVGRNDEAASIREDYKKSFHYVYAVMDKTKMTQEDIDAAEDYLRRIKNVTVLEVDASQTDLAMDLYGILKADADKRGGVIDGIQIFGTPDTVPAFNVQYTAESENPYGNRSVTRGGYYLTDLFYGNFNNDPSELEDFNVYDCFENARDIKLTPEWPVVRLPLKSGQYAGFLEKYDDFQINNRYSNPSLVNFSNPIFRSSDSADNMATFLERARDEFRIIKGFRLYGNLLGDYPIKNKNILGGFTAENLTKENEAGSTEFLINSHGQQNNIDKCWVEDGEEKRESLVNSETINSVLSQNPYYLDCWTCNNGYGMNSCLTTQALNGLCVGMFSATTVISNNGTDCKASLEDMKTYSNFYWFYYNYLLSLKKGLTRAGAFFNAQAAYADALMEDSKNGIRGRANYQFNINNLLAYHNFGVIEPRTTAKKIEAGTDPGHDDPDPGKDNPVSDTPVLEAEETSFTLIPGEVRRLNTSPDGQFIYGIAWKIEDISPKGCIVLNNGVVTAKKKGTAKVTASYCGFSAAFDITVDDTAPQNTYFTDGKKKVQVTAAKVSEVSVGNAGKKVTVNIPTALRDGACPVKYEISDSEVCEVSEPVYSNADRTKAAKAAFMITPVKAGAAWITWYMEDSNGQRTQAVTKVIVKQPVTSLTVDSMEPLKAGAWKRLVVTGIKDSTDTKDPTFSFKGKGVKITKSGYVIAAAPGGKGTVTVKAGKATAKVDVEVRSAQDGGDCIVLDKSSVTIKAGKTAIVKVSKPKNAGAISWSVPESSAGISVSNGKVAVDAVTAPGRYIIQAQDMAGDYNAAYCEVIVR